MYTRLLARMQGRLLVAARTVAARPAAACHLSTRVSVPAAAQAPSTRVWAKPAFWSKSLHASPVAMRSSSQEGPITSSLIAQMRSKIAAALETELVEVQDMQGDGRHVEITVISQLFDGKSAVARQRMVYKAIWEELQDTVHAVDAMVTRTPEEAGVQV